jgi:hypothetical protein
MELPKTPEEYAIWVGMQFPVLGASILLAWLVNRWNDAHRKEVLEELKLAQQALLTEKNERLADRDQQIRELKVANDQLRAKLSRSGKKDKGAEARDTIMIAAMIGYYVVAIGLVGLVGYLAGRKNNRELRAFAEQAIAELEQIARSYPPLEADTN